MSYYHSLTPNLLTCSRHVFNPPLGNMMYLTNPADSGVDLVVTDVIAHSTTNDGSGYVQIELCVGDAHSLAGTPTALTYFSGRLETFSSTAVVGYGGTIPSLTVLHNHLYQLTDRVKINTHDLIIPPGKAIYLQRTFDASAPYATLQITWYPWNA